MAFGQAPSGKVTALYCAVCVYRFLRVFRTTRVEPAVVPEEGADAEFVDPKEKYEDVAHQELFALFALAC